MTENENAKPTPGPWSVKRAFKPDNVGGVDYAILDAEQTIIAEVYEIPGNGQILPVVVNAHLIAAAPELLGALRLAISECIQETDWCPVCNSHGHNHSAVNCKALAAIAKAEGQEPSR